ncbi:MAG: hypothetical protein OEU46_01910 [Alphaproteobacteria bacterium]|nr:hypothetical protein [Alphaproteobacteria bacterium]
MSKHTYFLLVAALSAGVVAFMVSHKTAPVERVLWNRAIHVTVNADPAASLGTAFSWQNGHIVCAAGFINTNSSSRTSNQNDLEFWCRDTRAPVENYNFRSLGRISAEYLKSSIANVNGALVDYYHGRVLDRHDGKWRRYAGRIGRYRHPLGGHVSRLQRSGDRRWSFILGWRKCDGVAVLSDRGYHGSLLGAVGTTFIYRDRIFANVAGKVISYAIPPPRTGPCRAIGGGTVHVSDANRVYSMIPYGGALIIGGSARGRPCAALYRVRQGRTTALQVTECGERRVTEFYSYMIYGDDLLVGTYPDGNLAWIDGDTVRLTKMPIPLTGTKSDRQRYFEAQAMTIAAGDLVVGMYPWGQLYRRPFGGGPWRSQRLFTGPPLSNEPHPYHDAMDAKIAALGVRNSSNKRDRRARGLFRSAWGQRITSLAVFNGQLCAGTGNMSGSPRKSCLSFHGAGFARQGIRSGLLRANREPHPRSDQMAAIN